jgi:hypothetical protein
MKRVVVVEAGAQVFVWPRHVQLVLLRHWPLQRSQAEVQLVRQEVDDFKTMMSDRTAVQQSHTLVRFLLPLLFLRFVEANNLQVKQVSTLV